MSLSILDSQYDTFLGYFFAERYISLRLVCSLCFFLTCRMYCRYDGRILQHPACVVTAAMFYAVGPCVCN